MIFIGRIESGSDFLSASCEPVSNLLISGIDFATIRLALEIIS